MSEKPRREYRVVWRNRGCSYTAVIMSTGHRKACTKLEARLLSLGIKSYSVESVKLIEDSIPF